MTMNVKPGSPLKPTATSLIAESKEQIKKLNLAMSAKASKKIETMLSTV
jgi:hypothetical protein